MAHDRRDSWYTVHRSWACRYVYNCEAAAAAPNGVAVTAEAAISTAKIATNKPLQKNAALKKKLTCMLVRHGQSKGNLAQKSGAAHDSPRDGPLSPLGHE
jgi:hypothetical protein